MPRNRNQSALSLLESSDIDRFASVSDYALYCQMVESVGLSTANGEASAIASAATVTSAGATSTRTTTRPASTR